MAGRPPKNGGATRSVTTEVVLGRAAQSLSKAVAEAKVTFEQLNTLESKAEELTLKVANKEEELANIEVQIAEKERQAKVELEVRLKENAIRTASEVLAGQGKVAINSTELNDLRDELTQLKSDFATQVRAEIGKAEGIAKSRYESELKLKDAEFKAKEASNTAEIESLKKEVTSLKEQSAKWEQALSAERQASIERAKASAIGTIQVGSDTANGRR
jgi:chromosome segregation ATPase